jgi:hypothetical protein
MQARLCFYKEYNSIKVVYLAHERPRQNHHPGQYKGRNKSQVPSKEIAKAFINMTSIEILRSSKCVTLSVVTQARFNKVR